MTMFFFTISKELQSVVSQFTAFSKVPAARETVLDPQAKKEGKIKVLKVYAPRKIFCLFILLSRAIISLVLLYYGSLYLAYTIDLGDLLLNAVALEFVVPCVEK